MRTHRLLAGLTMLLTAVATASGHTATIDSSGAGYNGTLMINQAAGELQQQANARAIAPGSMPSVTVQQHLQGLSPDATSADLQAHIRGSAFSDGSGVLGVNQAAGVANQQINGFRLGAGVHPESLDDSSLAQSAAPVSFSSAAGSHGAGERLVEIDDQAFSDSRGVVQLNQGAGVGNRMVNNLGIRIVE